MNRLSLSIACLSLAGLLASACTFTTSPDDDGARGGLDRGQDGGSGGSGNGVDAGAGGTPGGSGGSDEYEVEWMCEKDSPKRDPGTCDWLDPGSPCEACLQQDCCEEISACDTIPEHQCFYGGPSGYGEWDCTRICLSDAVNLDDNGVIQPGVLEECLVECASSDDCGESVASVATEELSVCAMVLCSDVCFGEQL